MPDEPCATRREVDQLREELRAMRSDITAIAVIGTNLANLARDVTELKSDVMGRFADYQRTHEAEERSRVVGRRWLVGIGVAGLAACAAVISALAEILARLH